MLQTKKRVRKNKELPCDMHGYPLEFTVPFDELQKSNASDTYK